jgi:hypothetical protein
MATAALPFAGHAIDDDAVPPPPPVDPAGVSASAAFHDVMPARNSATMAIA